MVIALVKVYNEAQFIGATLTSLKDAVDRIVVIDGAYKLYYENYRKFDDSVRPWSTDGTIGIVEAFQERMDNLEIIPCKKPYLNQCVKLNAMLKQVSVGEWFFIIDGDEMVVGKFQEALEEIMKAGVIVGRVPLVNLGADVDRLHYFWHPRFFMRDDGMHYTGTHWHLRDKFGRIMENVYPVWWSQKCVVAHFKMLKPMRRIKPHLSYMDTLKARGWLEPLREELMKN